ncbi:MAG: HTH-type transcriptional regulator SrpR [Paracidovorax wautersii]|uniref:HTH-type transcriptional regulator SrpR n=1 Tax=Paracidovorax wautersii TaxID=1177982 RepID=A0A7V8FKP7_9BURK|nr:MAG: HTH-type transcriptional regulator SrpR [Paracidovorax wautersii]
MEAPANRKLRADAERNRRRLLDAAKAAFTAKGTSASLEDIARTAGVSIGTLYRHFPTREALIDEIYRDEGRQLAAAADDLCARLQPMDALHAWLLLFVRYFGRKQVLAGVLHCMNDDGKDSGKRYTMSVELIVQAMQSLLDRAAQAGCIASKNTEPLDLLCAIAGVATLGPQPGWEAHAKRLVEVLVAGLAASGDPQRQPKGS